MVAVPVFALTDLNQVRSRRAAEKLATARLLEQFPRSHRALFLDVPGANRLHGRTDLVYDPWLYPVFESIGLAEPRSIWLERALATGPVRVIATTSSRTEIAGLKRAARPRLHAVHAYRTLLRLGPPNRAAGVDSKASSPPNTTAALSVEFARCYTRGTWRASSRRSRGQNDGHQADRAGSGSRRDTPMQAKDRRTPCRVPMVFLAGLLLATSSPVLAQLPPAEEERLQILNDPEALEEESRERQKPAAF